MPKTNNDPKLAGGFNEAFELRFAMAATLLQMLYVWKMRQDAANKPNNTKVQSELLIAELTLGAAVVDLGATAIKALHVLKDEALSFQALKFTGGILSAGAGWIGASMDFDAANKLEKEGSKSLMWLYFAKGSTNIFSAISSALGTLSYLNPAIQAIKTRFPNTLLARASGAVFGRLFAWRAVLMLGGMGLSITVLLIQAAIWHFTDNALEKWLMRTPFSKIADKNRFHKSEITKMMDEFNKSLADVI